MALIILKYFHILFDSESVWGDWVPRTPSDLKPRFEGKQEPGTKLQEPGTGSPVLWTVFLGPRKQSTLRTAN